MKNKNFTYLLLIVVGIIWYQVFVRIKSNITEEPLVENEMGPSVIKKNMSRPEDFNLLANYRDPFLTNTYKEPSVLAENVENKLVEIPKIKPPKPQVFWPKIKYYGFVRNVESKKPRVVVFIDNMLFKMQVGEYVLDDIQLVKANRESATIKYNKEIREFQKTNK